MSIQLNILLVLIMTSGGLAAIRTPRLTLAADAPNYYYTNVNDNPGTYSFGYDVLDPATGNMQYRSEERYPNGTVVGTYGYTDSKGMTRRIDYTADEKGYRVKSVPLDKEIHTSLYTSATTEPSVTWTRPSKPKRDKANRYPTKYIARREYNKLQPPSVYILY